MVKRQALLNHRQTMTDLPKIYRIIPPIWKVCYDVPNFVLTLHSFCTNPSSATTQQRYFKRVIMNTTKLDSVIVEHRPTADEIRHAVIWLHGLGASGHDFEPVVPELGVTMPVRFVFPHAPVMPVTINGGYAMPAWYDILEMSLERKVDVAQIIRSSEAINQLINEQIAQGIASENIIIAGFSQGGAVAYHTVLTNTRKLGGLLALSTYFATASEIDQVLVNGDVAVKIDHGDFDDIVPPILGVQAKEKLEKLGLSPTLSCYPMAHQVCLTQIKAIGAWINERFAG